VKLDALLRAHSYLRVERPPELWEADTDDRGLIPLLGEMIAASLRYETLELSELTLNASNVVVEEGGPGGPPAGAFVALTVSGPAARESEAAWSPGVAASGWLGRMHENLLAARVRYAYIRRHAAGGSITLFLRRLP